MIGGSLLVQILHCTFITWRWFFHTRFTLLLQGGIIYKHYGDFIVYGIKSSLHIDNVRIIRVGNIQIEFLDRVRYFSNEISWYGYSQDMTLDPKTVASQFSLGIQHVIYVCCGK